MGKDLQNKLTDLSNGTTTQDETNPQTLWRNYKKTIQKMAKKTTNKSRHKVTAQLKNLEKDQKDLTCNPNFDLDENLRVRENFLAYEIKHLQSSEAWTS